MSEPADPGGLDPEASPASDTHLGLITGTMLVIASMVGTGVFTTSGFSLGGTPSTTAVLFAWFLGGLSALCGALSYAELGAALPRNGGEYQLLSRVYHPALGWLSGCVSLTVGFSAPVAAAAMAFGKYFKTVYIDIPDLEPFKAEVWLGLLLVAVCCLLHLWNVAWGSRFQNIMTGLKVLLIVGLTLAGAGSCHPSRVTGAQEIPFSEAVFSGSFSVNLMFISFSYAGWNSVVYLSGEIRNPKRNIPLALMLGTLCVTVFYLAINFVFLSAGPIAALQNKAEIAQIAFKEMQGERAGQVVATLIMFGLISTVGAMMMAGPRVLEAMGHDYPALKFVTHRPSQGGPILPTLIQGVLASLMLITSSFDGLVMYTAVTLSFFSSLAVLGVFVLRFREPNLPRGYRVWGYPITPVIFLLLEGWMIGTIIMREVQDSTRSWKSSSLLWSVVTMLIGLGLYFAMRPKTTPPASADSHS